MLLTIEPPLAGPAADPRAVVVATGETLTNVLLADTFARLGYSGEIVQPSIPLDVGPGDIVLGRLDVRRTLDGVEDGLWELAAAEHKGALLLNGPQPLYAAHDKLTTALMLGRSGIRHPATVHVIDPSAAVAIEPPYVVKPRFGSWGRDVFRCESAAELERLLASLTGRAWFRAHGAVVQQLVGSGGRDLRLVVAGSVVVGAIERIAQPGEWRTNVALGAVRRPVTAPTGARLLALQATAALGLDLAGVDLVLDDRGEYVVLEVNGAVDFTAEYARGGDVFAAAAAALIPASAATAAAS